MSIYLIQAECPKAECFESLSAMELAEQITLLDHIVFRSIPYEWVELQHHTERCRLQASKDTREKKCMKNSMSALLNFFIMGLKKSSCVHERRSLCRHTSIRIHWLCSCCREFLGQGWMKTDKSERTPYIMKTSQHFNDVSIYGNIYLLLSLASYRRYQG